MDLATIIGLIAAACCVAASIVAAGASFGAFYDLPSVLVVLGGATGAVMMSFPLRNFLGLGKITKNVIFNKTPDIASLIETIVDLAETARRDGLLALENKLDTVDNPFIILGVQMAVDGTMPPVNPLWTN